MSLITAVGGALTFKIITLFHVSLVLWYFGFSFTVIWCFEVTTKSDCVGNRTKLPILGLPKSRFVHYNSVAINNWQTERTLIGFIGGCLVLVNSKIFRRRNAVRYAWTGSWTFHQIQEGCVLPNVSLDGHVSLAYWIIFLYFCRWPDHGWFMWIE